MRKKKMKLTGFTKEEKQARQRKLVRIWYAENRESQIAYYREYYRRNSQSLKEKRCTKP
jgi:hypothetical protein